jgi:hypothetical protein
MSNEGNPATEEEIALYDVIECAIANVHAALAEIDAAWVRITAQRPPPIGDCVRRPRCCR